MCSLYLSISGNAASKSCGSEKKETVSAVQLTVNKINVSLYAYVSDLQYGSSGLCWILDRMNSKTWHNESREPIGN